MKRTMSWRFVIPAFLFLAVLVGCRPEADRLSDQDTEHEENGGGAVLALPELAAVELSGAPLTVIATTSIIGDVVAQVGGEAIDLTTLMGPGQDPHSYEPTPQEMAAVSLAHVLFVNGWDLEEALAYDLKEIAEDVLIVPISAGIQPLEFGGHDEHEGAHTEGQAEEKAQHEKDERASANANAVGAADPHVWFSIDHVEQWVENVEHVLAALDPANAETYERNAEAYRAELKELDAYAREQLSSIPDGKRYLVTNHDSLGYLAHEYGLHVLGTVLPAASTVAEPSASDLAALIGAMEERGLCTVFAETTASLRLAETVAAELADCDEVAVLKLYTGSVGPAGSGAEGYVGMFRHNVDTIVEGLR